MEKIVPNPRLSLVERELRRRARPFTPMDAITLVMHQRGIPNPSTMIDPVVSPSEHLSPTFKRMDVGAA
jgi:hypothetical protein